MFETLNSERTEVMNGLERLARNEKELAEQIRSDTFAMYELQDAATPDQRSSRARLPDRVEYAHFRGPAEIIRYACEVPVIIEKRLFALSRAIAQTMEP